MGESEQETLQDILSSAGFSHFGFTALRRPDTFDHYRTWLAAGCHGDMEYLEAHAPLKEDPKKLVPQAESAIVVSVPYHPHPRPVTPSASGQLPVALYALGSDYHGWLNQRLTALCQRLNEKYPQEFFIPFTDSKPVLERDLASRSGIGWIGKNTCLLNRNQGSLTFLAEIYTSLRLHQLRPPAKDHCGTCRRCIDACPTGALSSHHLDARKCISYLTIESKSIPTPELRLATGQYFFGCDICQIVCPWNKKVHPSQSPSLQKPDPHIPELSKEIHWILQASNRQLERRFTGTPLLRARPFGLRRNAMLVAAHYGLKDISPYLLRFFADQRLGELAKWTHNHLLTLSSNNH